jgi:hypothetical protein
MAVFFSVCFAAGIEQFNETTEPFSKSRCDNKKAVRDFPTYLALPYIKRTFLVLFFMELSSRVSFLTKATSRFQPINNRGVGVGSEERTHLEFSGVES